MGVSIAMIIAVASSAGLNEIPAAPWSYVTTPAYE